MARSLPMARCARKARDSQRSLPPEKEGEPERCLELASTDACVCFGSQTGSGKTHSVVGKIGDEKEAGLLPRAVRHVFEGLCATEGPSEFAVSCCYLEIYKEVRAPTLGGAACGGA